MRTRLPSATSWATFSPSGVSSPLSVHRLAAFTCAYRGWLECQLKGAYLCTAGSSSMRLKSMDAAAWIVSSLTPVQLA